jgi:hypothetical protein
LIEGSNTLVGGKRLEITQPSVSRLEMSELEGTLNADGVKARPIGNAD